VGVIHRAIRSGCGKLALSQAADGAVALLDEELAPFDVLDEEPDDPFDDPEEESEVPPDDEVADSDELAAGLELFDDEPFVDSLDRLSVR
jgi:hypothetical protein